MPTNFIFMAFYFVLSKGASFCTHPLTSMEAQTSVPLPVYANSFFAALNTRRSIRGRGTEGEHTTVPTFLMIGQTTKQEVHVDPVYSVVRAGTQLDLPSASRAGNASDDFLDMAADMKQQQQQHTVSSRSYGHGEYSPRIEVPREPVRDLVFYHSPLCAD